MSQVQNNKNANELATLFAGTSISRNPKTHVAPKYLSRFSRSKGYATRKFKLGKAKFKYVPNYIKTRRKMEKPILHTITETRKKGKSIKNIIGKVENRLNVNGKRRPFRL